MSRFTQELNLIPLAGRIKNPTRVQERSWILNTPDFAFEIGGIGSGKVVSVPLGFITDLASVPRPLWPFIAPFGVHGPAAVVHDYLYREGDRERFSRSDSDAIFHEAMKVSGTPRLRAWLMWVAVRCGGFLRWRQLKSNARF